MLLLVASSGVYMGTQKEIAKFPLCVAELSIKSFFCETCRFLALHPQGQNFPRLLIRCHQSQLQATQQVQNAVLIDLQPEIQDASKG